MSNRGGSGGRSRPPRGRDGGHRGGGNRERGGFRGDAPARQPGGVFSDPDQASEVDGRLDTGDQESLVNAFSSLTVGNNDLPLRPGWGENGTPIKMRSNFFPVEIPRDLLCEYDIKITPAVTVRRVKHRIFELLEQQADYARFKTEVAHDFGAKLIAPKRLPQPLTFNIPYFDEDESGPRENGKTYTVEITFIQDIDLSTLTSHLSGDTNYREIDVAPIFAALNIVLAQHPARSGVTVGRNRFFFPNEIYSLGGGLETWRGFYSSVRPAYKQLMVNVNVATTAFYSEGNLANAMMKFGDTFVRGIRVATIHLRQRKTVKKVSKFTSRSHKFMWDEAGRQVSVEEYFQTKYGTRLQYPNLFLVDVGGVKSNLLPPEVCQILPGQHFRGRLTDEHTKQMIRHACKPPNVNARTIVGPGLHSLGFTTVEQPLPGFGIKIGRQMTVVPGRILPAPRVMYSQKEQKVDQHASWNLRNVRFSRGAVLDKWGVLIIKDGNGDAEFQGTDDPELRDTISGFSNMCITSGMTVHSQPQFIQVQLPSKNQNDPTRKGAIETIRSSIMSLDIGVDLLMVILSSGDKHIYAGIKHLCDVQLDIHTVCVQSEKIRRDKGQPQYFANVALKVNMKLGGVNHDLDLDSMQWLNQELTMMVGMDVTHPGPGSLRGTPSIAAVVASVDEYYAQFPASLRIQEMRKEMITSLEDMMIERLEAFKESQNDLPTRVLVYRDGVSEGQYRTVVDDEMPSIIESFRKYDKPDKPYRPKLTIVVCGKRHHTRFFPIDPSNADQLGNPRPGTVVDQGVTGVYAFDFFLQAHGGLQGTTRPTHYYVVHDEIKFGADQLQKLTNDVSYMFARATKAVSLVSPAYYADLACERGRCYIHELFHAAEATTASSSAEDEVMRTAEGLWRDGVRGQLLRNSMFYL